MAKDRELESTGVRPSHTSVSERRKRGQDGRRVVFRIAGSLVNTKAANQQVFEALSSAFENKEQSNIVEFGVARGLSVPWSALTSQTTMLRVLLELQATFASTYMVSGVPLMIDRRTLDMWY
jgi:hypothetical protein